MNLLITVMTRVGLLREDLDYHLLRASMVIISCFLAIKSGSIELREFSRPKLEHAT